MSGSERIEKTTLWRNAFALHEDGHDDARQSLIVGLRDFRKNVAQLVTHIAADMKGYTVHDISHLDALWEMASLIGGDQFKLNPAEAFVFGGAVLLHDSGMTTAAYVGGLEELKNFAVWRDAYELALAKVNGNPALADSCVESATIDTLRRLHAEKAAAIATQA